MEFELGFAAAVGCAVAAESGGFVVEFGRTVEFEAGHVAVAGPVAEHGPEPGFAVELGSESELGRLEPPQPLQLPHLPS